MTDSKSARKGHAPAHPVVDPTDDTATKVALRTRGDDKEPVTAELPDAEPPEKLSTLAGEYIGLSIAGGLVVGVLIGALFPRALAKRLAGRSSKIAAVAGEMGLAYAAQALARAGETAREGRDKAIDMGELVAERSADVRDKATRLIGDGSEKARENGSSLVRKAAEFVSRARS